MKSSFLIIGALALFIVAPNDPACAQQAVGRSVVAGKSVTLYDNGTWLYEDSQESGCRTLGAGISFCGSSDAWKYTASSGSDSAASFRHDDRHYAMVIVEALGVEDGLTQKYMRGAVISNAALAANVPDEEIIVLGVEAYESFSYPTETVVYGTSLDGVGVTYANTIVTKPHQTFQLITYAIGNGFTPQHKELHSDFLNSVELD